MPAVSNSTVVAIVVTYNRKELLSECIKALQNQKYPNCKILIVDNASTDGTEQFVKPLIDNKTTFYQNTGKNLGGAGGFNYGMKAAHALGCDFMWLMDDDCIVHEDTLPNLLSADRKLAGRYGFFASKVLWKDGSICQMNIPKKTFSSWLKDHDTNFQPIAMSSFVSFFIPTKNVIKFGLPIKEFFIWTDDWEYSRRISRHLPGYFISDSIVTHKCVSNTGARIDTDDGSRLDRFKYLYRNDVVLYRREGLKGIVLLKLRILLHKFRILTSPAPDKSHRIHIINSAIHEGKTFFPKIEHLGANND